jgi:hypothetical protein
MPGRGLPPKDPSRRARRNKDPHPTRVVQARAASQPDLPDHHDWHAETAKWWAMWGESPLAASFTAEDWSFLLETAVVHSLFWFGDSKAAAELRLRVAKFGATPEDRLRLRIQFAESAAVDEPAQAEPAVAARQRYSHLTVVDEAVAQ